MLWFVQHMLWDFTYTPDFDPEAWTNYAFVNAKMARAVIDELDRDPDALVFFQDYHLYLAPTIVRRQRPDARMAHFVHIPWPESGAWSVLPPSIRRAVFAGLLANDVVAFHTNRWRRNFLRGCEDVLGADVDGDVVELDGRRTLVTARPIGIDTGEFDALVENPNVLAHERELLASRPEMLVLRVIGQILPRTSSAACARSVSCSSATRSCAGACACSRCSTRRDRTFRSTSSTSLRSSGRRARSATPSISESATTSREPSRRTSSSTCCS